MNVGTRTPDERGIIWDEGALAKRPCQLHKGALHTHLAVCRWCRQPLTADMSRGAFCQDVITEVAWKCVEPFGCPCAHCEEAAKRG